jgi:hypothetical protein
LNAIQALSQLSYAPVLLCASFLLLPTGTREAIHG